MKKILRVLLVLAIALPMLIGCKKEEEEAGLPDKILVGCLEPLTGAHAVFGTEAKIGMEIAVEHINEGGGIESLGGLPLELVVEDSGENADSAKLGAESLISKHHPVAILGLYISRLTVAASEVTEREKVILIQREALSNIAGLAEQLNEKVSPTDPLYSLARRIWDEANQRL